MKKKAQEPLFSDPRLSCMGMHNAAEEEEHSQSMRNIAVAVFSASIFYNPRQRFELKPSRFPVAWHYVCV
jgi:hypothetical protein